MELSVLCDCDIALFLFGPVDNRLAQYTSSEMEGLLDRYSRTCQQPHETRTNQDVSTVPALLMPCQPVLQADHVTPVLLCCSWFGCFRQTWQLM